MCTEEGQVLFHNGSSKEDRSCRCDFENGYAFVYRPKHPCKCTPALEDCSCYAKQCFVHFKLTPGPPYNVHVSRDMKKLKLTWSKPRIWSAIKEYRIYHASNSLWEIQPFTVKGADNLCFDITSNHIQFLPCTTYRFEISAYSSDYGESLRSEEAKFDTENPTNMVYRLSEFSRQKLKELNRKGENGNIALVWTHPGDNVFTIDNYKLEIEVGLHFETHMLSANTYEFLITNALHQTYLFRIYSCCQEFLSDPLQCKFFGEHAYFVDMSYDGIDKRVDERMFAPKILLN
ncbi:unnamed protein product [Mytilus edulis]|uniref:Fibronectin type-III domain-containing protein n=1 Tax=Mytilus edulis TaxID=6550 RepID=A0A8S3VH04_MYTED|nr:unnamed protein product [Mytilus edulis]